MKVKTKEILKDYIISLFRGMKVKENTEYNYYYFQDKYPKYKNFDKGFRELFKDVSDIRSGITRFEYDDADYTNWTLIFGEDKEKLKEVEQRLEDIKIRNNKVFNISGNGWGTGLSVMLNYKK